MVVVETSTESHVTFNPYITEQKRKEKPQLLPRPHAKCPAAQWAVSWSCTCRARVCFVQTSLASLCALSLLRNGKVILRNWLVEMLNYLHRHWKRKVRHEHNYIWIIWIFFWHLNKNCQHLPKLLFRQLVCLDILELLTDKECNSRDL